MNYSRKHKKVVFTKLMHQMTGICCSRQFIYWCGQNNLSVDEIRYLINDTRQFIYWCGQNNLSVDEIRYLINDGWHLEKSPSKSFKLHSNAVYGKSVKEGI